MRKTFERHPGIPVFCAIVLLIVVSRWGLDFSAFHTFTMSMMKETVSGLLHPDWSYFYDGSSEDVFSMMLMMRCRSIFASMISTWIHAISLR